jgi:outer membrane murein-binding lipoprotein Lpp
MRRILLMLCLLAPGQPAVAQTTASDISKKTAEAWNTVKSYTVEKKNDAVAYGRKLVRGTDRQIKSLERRAAKASGEAKTQLDSDVQELKAKRAAASRKLDEMGKATGAAWDEAKNGFADAYKDLQDSADRAVKKLK